MRMFKRDVGDPQGALTIKPMMSRFLPVFIEQGLGMLIGIVSTILVSNVGDYAVSGVNLVDTINFMVIAAFNALAAGATVEVSHNIGARDGKLAAETAQQSIVLCALSALVLGLATSAGSGAILASLYGSAEPRVIDAGGTYFFFSGFSYVFLGLSAACGGVMRACGNPRTPMVASIIANIVNVLIALSLIALGWGVLGVSIAMLVARATGGLFCYYMLRSGHGGIVLPTFSMRMSMSILRPVLRVGIPSGVDSVIFNGAKVVLAVFMSGMGTEALHANAIAGSLSGFLNLPGNTLSINVVTLAGRSYGARNYARIRYLTGKILLYASACQLIFFVPLYLLLNPIIALYGPTPFSADLTRQLLTAAGLLIPLFWPFAFVLPQMLRSCGDATAAMCISIISLFSMRMLGAWFFGIYLDMGVMGVWLGMFCDWVLRGAGFMWRFLSNRWNGGYMPINEGDTTVSLWG